MRYAIISDIHSNLEALEALLAKISGFKVDDILCLGDIVGYNANPNECIDLVRKSGIRCVMGNHDSRASGLEEPDNFTPLAKESVLWTREHLTEEHLHEIALKTSSSVTTPNALAFVPSFFLIFLKRKSQR